MRNIKFNDITIFPRLALLDFLFCYAAPTFFFLWVVEMRRYLTAGPALWVGIGKMKQGESGPTVNYQFQTPGNRKYL